MTEATPRAGFPGPKALGWIMTVCGAVGLLAAFVLTVEKIVLLRDPEYVPSCSINPVLSCGSVMSTPQAEVFGFPNPLLGIAAFAAVAAAGAALLAGTIQRRWFWLGLQAGTTFGLVFVHWLIYQSLYVIGALCPWCLLITVTTTLVWAGITRINVRDGHLNLPGRWGPWGRRFVASGNDWFVTVAVLVLFAAVVFARYGWTLFV